MKRSGRRSRAASASSRAAVGATFPARNSANVRRLVTPATWNTASTPSSAGVRPSAAASVSGAACVSTRSASDSGSESGAGALSGRTRRRTVHPAPASASTRCEPTNPELPVTSAITC